MDYEIISNLNVSLFNFSLETDITPEQSTAMSAHEIIISLVCLSGIGADALIIYMLLTYKKLRTPTNIFVLNWACADLLYLLITPCFYRIFAALESFLLSEVFFCVTIETATILQIAIVLFNGVLCIIWFVNVFVIYQGQMVTYITTSIWSLTLVLIIVFSMFCVHEIFYLLSLYVTFFGYTILLHMVVLMHICAGFRRFRNLKPYNKSRYISTLTTAYVLCCLPSWLCILCASLVRYLSVVAACVGYLNSVANVVILYRFNKHFKTGLIQTFQRRSGGYVDATETFESESEVDGDDVSSSSQTVV